MRMRMQGRQTAILVIVAISVVLFGLVHVVWRISDLEVNKRKLELAVAKLQVDKINSNIRKPGVSQAAEEGDDEEAPVADEDDLVVIYNRVPKTGSTSFAGVAYSLCGRNEFTVLHINTSRNSHVLSLSDQIRFAKNITRWNSKKPAFYHGHVAYLDFARLGIKDRPVYINLIRDPLDRLISYYYFLRNGDDFRPHLKRRKMGDKETFDECVAKQGSDCDPEELWLQIPFFCGHNSNCWIPGNKWALETAKYNLVHNYLVVGLTEDLDSFVAILEAALPRIFKGGYQKFITGEKSHLRKTANKLPPKEETIERIHESPIWQMENEFYQFAKNQFEFIKRKTLRTSDDGDLLEIGRQFRYEKIRPR